MPKTSLVLVHDTGAPAFDPSALRDADGEPRVRDLDLAQGLGFTDPHKIRALISRNTGELATHGEVSATAAETSTAGGRPGKEYWLNEGQALCRLRPVPHPPGRPGAQGADRRVQPMRSPRAVAFKVRIGTTLDGYADCARDDLDLMAEAWLCA